MKTVMQVLFNTTILQYYSILLVSWHTVSSG